MPYHRGRARASLSTDVRVFGDLARSREQRVVGLRLGSRAVSRGCLPRAEVRNRGSSLAGGNGLCVRRASRRRGGGARGRRGRARHVVCGCRWSRRGLRSGGRAGGALVQSHDHEGDREGQHRDQQHQQDVTCGRVARQADTFSRIEADPAARFETAAVGPPTEKACQPALTRRLRQSARVGVFECVFGIQQASRRDRRSRGRCGRDRRGSSGKLGWRHAARHLQMDVVSEHGARGARFLRVRRIASPGEAVSGLRARHGFGSDYQAVAGAATHVAHGRLASCGPARVGPIWQHVPARD
jgi:hypothetical protein